MFYSIVLSICVSRDLPSNMKYNVRVQEIWNNGSGVTYPEIWRSPYRDAVSPYGDAASPAGDAAPTPGRCGISIRRSPKSWICDTAEQWRIATNKIGA